VKDLYNIRGALSMANAGPNTNGSQFFIVQNSNLPYSAKELSRGGWPEPIAEIYATKGGTPHLDRRHTVFGQMLAKKKDYMDRHFANIARSRAVLVCNYEKNNEPGYIGANTLMEMTVAYVSGVSMYLLEKPGGGVNTKAPEIAALGGIVLPDGDVAGLIDVLKQGEDHE